MGSWYVMTMGRSWEIYALADPRTGEVRYVGVTHRGSARRLVEHLSRARKGGRTHRDCWIRSLLSAGVSPTMAVIEVGNGVGWQSAERKWIAHHALSVVNHTAGGDGTPGCIPSPATREKWSAQRRGVRYAPGRVGAMKGRTHTPEARAKIAAASTGRAHSPEAKAKLSKAHTGKKLSPEHRAFLAKLHTGTKHTAEHKAKIAAATTTRKPVVCDATGEAFESITAASRALGVSEASVYQALRKGCLCRGRSLRRA